MLIFRFAEPLPWSDEAGPLYTFCKEQQRQRRTQRPIQLSRSEVISRFQTLWLQSCELSECGEGLAELSSLKELSLSNNNLAALESLPANLQVLRANANWCVLSAVSLLVCQIFVA